MKKIVLLLSLLSMLTSCQSQESLDLKECKSLELSYLMGGPITIIEDEELNKVTALLEDYNEISIEDQDDVMSLKAINVLLVYQDERSLSIMVYPDSFATITDGKWKLIMEADRPDEGPLFPVGGQSQLRPPRGGGGACGHRQSLCRDRGDSGRREVPFAGGLHGGDNAPLAFAGPL